MKLIAKYFIELELVLYRGARIISRFACITRSRLCRPDVRKGCAFPSSPLFLFARLRLAFEAQPRRNLFTSAGKGGAFPHIKAAKPHTIDPQPNS